MLPNPYVILAVVAFFIISMGTEGILAYNRGKDDMKAAYTSQQLDIANKNLKLAQTQTAVAAAAGVQHDDHVTKVNVDTSAIARQMQGFLANLPHDQNSDPFVPVWFVRMHDRAAGRQVTADPYPGQSDSAPSDVRLSEAVAMLNTNYGKCEVNRKTIDDIIALKPVLPDPVAPPSQSFLNRINPFQ
jgi:hypothetical protein